MTRWVPARHAARHGIDLLGDPVAPSRPRTNGPQRRTSARGRPFTSQADGWGRSHTLWMCLACRARVTKRAQRFPGEKVPPPRQCGACGLSELLKFDSEPEEQRFRVLMRMQMEGTIRGLEHHPEFELRTVSPDGDPVPLLRETGSIIIYQADSQYWMADGEWVVEDVKPKAKAGLDPVFDLKRAIVQQQFGVRIRLMA